MEISSITLRFSRKNECFANMSGYEGLGADQTQLGFRIKEKVFRNVGILTCVGIAPTKTLAKYCNHLAKHYAGLKGVCNWLDLTPQRQERRLPANLSLKI